MIKIFKNVITDVPFTLFEKTTYSAATYICELYNNQNHDNTLFYLTGDTTTNNARFNYFPINETPLNLLEGTYDYFVWQTTGATLSVSGLTTSYVVESGLCKVIGTGSTQTTYTSTINEYTYEG